ncbi:MAG: PhoH family protein [Bacteroidales bacterium]|nr:PhoH family protein [Candidatus Colicola caccequi]MCQ2327869.1 PhoH family protein [Paludibacteraceae bacterium]
MDAIIELNETLDTTTFYGLNNRNMLCLKDQHPDVRVVARGYEVKVTGSESSIQHFEQSLRACEEFCIQHNALTEVQILQILHGERPEPQKTANLILHGVGGKMITARSLNQQKLVDAYRTNDLLLAVGPAGSGKTYTAIALAVRALKNKEVKRIILSRPAVEAGEKLGFLPGDMREKIDPYLQPLYDALQDMIPSNKLEEYMEKGVIQIAPLAFMRGRTLSDAVVILDEAQNTTIAQLKMFLTRLGINGKMIVTGDLTQVDLPMSQKSGLRDAIERFKQIAGIACITFTDKDIVRHPLVKEIVKAYNTNDNE